MRRVVVGLLVLMLMVFIGACSKKEVKTEPVQQEQKKIEKVEEQVAKVDRPELTEEEIFQRQTLEELNRKGYLQRIHFDYDKYQVRDDMKPILEANAQWLLKFNTVIVAIGGHCDERGTEEYNMALGEKRAEAAKKYLVSLGVSEDRLRTVSYGKTQPLVKGLDDQTFYQNRRDEFVIIKK